MCDQTEAWNRLYRTQGRPWRGASDTEFPFTPGGRVLDVGCGNGKTSVALAEKGYEVTGIDLSREAVDRCARYVPGMRAVCASVTGMPFGDGEFDGVAVVHVMEHLDDEEIAGMAAEVLRVLRPGGVVLARSFGNGDLRSGKGRREGVFEIRGNGIRYRYFDGSGLRNAFRGFAEVSVRTEVRGTRFGGSRVLVEGVFEKT